MIWRVVTFATAGLIASTLGYWANDREPPTRLISAEVVTKSVPPGGELRIRYKIERLRSCRMHIDRVLFDHEKVRRDLEDVDYAAAPGSLGDQIYVMSLTIPRNAALGEARFRTITTYYCNPLHSYFSPIIAVDEMVVFEIAGDPSDEGPIEVIPRR